MTKSHSMCRRNVPKANNATILSNEYVEKARALLEEYGELPLINFASFWDIKYDECIDFVSLKYDGGLLGFLRDNNHLFELTRNKDRFLVVSLVSRPVSRDSSDLNGVKENITHDALGRAITKQRSIGRTIHRLFNETNFLWENQLWRKVLKKKDISIALSAYESALDIHFNLTRNMVDTIRRVLQKYSLGLKVTELYIYIDTVQALKIFNVSTSMVSLVDELPEIFYRKKMPKSEDDLIFDGSTHTISDLTGNDDKLFEGGSEPEVIVTRAVNGGLYQKTLVLIRETGQVKGLKINVWMKSMRRNFYAKDEDAFDRDLKKINTLTFFLALARYNLIELRSHEVIKNDIRAFLPRKYIDFRDLKSKLTNLINLDSNSEGPDSISDDTTNDEPQNRHVAVAKSILKAKQN